MLVDLQTVKDQLRLDSTDYDVVITTMIEQASSIILDYLKLEEAPDEVPEFVQVATIFAVKALFDGGDPLSDVVKSLLRRYRDPAYA